MNKERICAIVRDLLPSYLERLTEPESSVFISRHLTECEACRSVRRHLLHASSAREQEQAALVSCLRRAHRRRQLLFLLAALLLILLTGLCFLPLPRRVDMQVQAFCWRAGRAEEDGRPVEIILQGTYLDYLFRTDRYEGDLMIEGVAITQQPGAFAGCTLDDSGLMYYANEERLLEATGFLIASPGMNEFVIGLYERNADGVGSWSAGDGIVLTYPANHREEAVENTRSLLRLLRNRLANSTWEAGLTGPEAAPSSEG